MSTTIHLYSAIGTAPGQFSAKAFADSLTASKGAEVLLRVNSTGGDVAEALAIVSQISTHRDRITARVDGIAASAASLIVAACRAVEMAPDALLMVHNPSTQATGEASDLRAAADKLDTFRAQLVAVYSRRSKLPADELDAMLNAETWLNATQAVSAGFADTILPALIQRVSNLAAPVMAVCVMAELRRDLEAITTERDALKDAAAQARVARIEATVNNHVPANGDRAAVLKFCVNQADDGKAFLAAMASRRPSAEVVIVTPGTYGDVTPSEMLAQHKEKLRNFRQ